MTEQTDNRGPEEPIAQETKSVTPVDIIRLRRELREETRWRFIHLLLIIGILVVVFWWRGNSQVERLERDLAKAEEWQNKKRELQLGVIRYHLERLEKMQTEQPEDE